MNSATHESRIPVVAALQVLIDLRREDQIVVTNQASARIWPKLSSQVLDLHYNPSTMGGAVPLALGLAIAQPDRHVLVVSGDGALLMNLGSLVTVVGSGVTNLTIVVLENRLYEVTGGQQLPGAPSPVDFAGLAHAAGFATAESFQHFAEWQRRARQILAAAGPRFISLAVDRTPDDYLHFATPPLAEQLQTLQEALKRRKPSRA